MVEKKKLLWDNFEVPGLVLFPELKLEDGVVIVPGYDKEVTIENGIIKIPPLELKYKIEKNTNTMQFWRDFRFNRQIKNAEMLRTDAYGNIIERWLLQLCSCASISIPPYDAENVTYASLTALVLASDIIPL